MIVIHGGTRISGGSCALNKDIYIQGDKIVNEALGTEEIQTFHVEGLYIAPGFIDIHTHGGIGFRFEEITAEKILQAAAFNTRNGVTTVVPTYEGAQAPLSKEWEIYDAVYGAMGLKNGPEILGMHFEGPFCSRQYALGEEVVPDKTECIKMLNRAKALCRWTVAPEIEGVQEIIEEAGNRNICVSLGHSAATIESVDKAIKNGATQVTHLYSGMNGVYRENMVRKPGLIEIAYLRPLYVEVVCDGAHLDVNILKLIYQIKGADYICIVSDSHYREIGEGETFESVGRIRCLERPGGVALDSAMPYNEMLRILKDEVNIPMTDIVKMASLTPAKAMKIEHRKGKIAAGYDADITVFDDDFNIKLVIARGKVMYNTLN